MSSSIDSPLQILSKAQPSIAAAEVMIEQIVHQLLHGCASADCRSGMCDTGRRNANLNRPIRKWTPRSARVIALAILSRPNPSSYLCSHSTKSSLSARPSGPEGPRDPSSFTQALSDTVAIRTFRSVAVESGWLDLGDLKRAHRALDSVTTWTEQEDSEPSVVSNHQAATQVMTSLQLLLEKTPKTAVAYHRFAARHVMTGRAVPAEIKRVPSGQHWHVWSDDPDAYDHEPSLRLLSRVAQVVSLRESLDVEMQRTASETHPPHPTNSERESRYFITILASKLSALSPPSQSQLCTWLHRVFLHHWDGGTMLKLGSPCHGALDMFQLLDIEQPLLTLASHLDTIKIATSWMESRSKSSTARHLLDFPKLFTHGERITYFRMMNHLLMQSMSSAAEKTARLSRRVAFRPFGYEPQGVLEYAEEHYLLLNVSRENVLRDAYDQLWQRRKSELLRPLRVRLGEMDELEVGQDLGGVQIEFFNLLCKHVGAVENQLLNTDPTSGISYYWPMSLQPLYMFELLGTLFGLALHNGITLPVSLPLYFYRSLLCYSSDSTSASQCDDATLEDIKDGWPAMYRSLRTMLTQSEAPFYVDYAFPVEANGLRLTATAAVKEQVLMIHDITADVHHRTTKSPHEGIDLQGDAIEVLGLDRHNQQADQRNAENQCNAIAVELFDEKLEFRDWPGWTLKHSPDEPPSVTNDNKQSYTDDYAKWLLLTSVQPQRQAFERGFSAVMPARMISCFSPVQLQTLLEGTTALSIPDLRRVTRYQGYDRRSLYMQWFWRVVSSWPEQRQRGLLKFVTAAERIPIGGAGHLTFVIEKSDFGDTEQLPTSSTCFGTLRLPRYESEKVLERKLRMAIEYGNEGFGSA